MTWRFASPTPKRGLLVPSQTRRTDQRIGRPGHRPDRDGKHRWRVMDRSSGLANLEPIEQLKELLAEARVLQPKVWKGQPVTYTDDTGEVKTVGEFRSAAVAVRAVELMLRLAGLDQARSAADIFGEVVFIRLTRGR